uniref:Uncharacterized protein n=1 Tax=Timema monikensis TaxID=170555 RepID=A0A7R9EM96_9NEOP|nr:unnamed protein product [Timema monikensis]
MTVTWIRRLLILLIFCCSWTSSSTV